MVMESRGPRRSMAAGMAPPPAASAEDLGVTIEAEFSVAEYDIVILSARDSSGLDTWLRQENYNIPQGAEPVLRPYVEAGTKFFVAKVDAERVTFVDGRAVLSPLRFHYESSDFNLPVRLGLLNSRGNQDLLVHILARGQRYEVANYANTTIPTNIRVKDEVRESFGSFYDILFRRAVASNARTVVTEYSWDASSCDPCPTPPLNPGELTTLGADVIPGHPGGFVLTRLHYRYNQDSLSEDLVFRAAPPIVGGRGMPRQDGTMAEGGAQPGSMNNFQGRYVILHKWQGEIACDDPQRGSWGGPPGQGNVRPLAARNMAMDVPEQESAQAGAELTSIGPLIRDDIPALGISAGQVEQPMPGDPGPPGAQAAAEDDNLGVHPIPSGPAEGGCASCSVGAHSRHSPASLAFLCGLVLIGLGRRRLL